MPTPQPPQAWTNLCMRLGSAQTLLESALINLQLALASMDWTTANEEVQRAYNKLEAALANLE